MTEEVDGVLLTDGQNSVLLHPPEPYSDGHGCHHQVDLVAGPFRGSIDASSYEGHQAFGHFRDQLAALYQNLKGEARLSQAYENLKLALQGDGLGHISVRVDVIAGTYMDTKLSFSFVIDQTQLPKIIAGIERFRVSFGSRT